MRTRATESDPPDMAESTSTSSNKRLKTLVSGPALIPASESVSKNQEELREFIDDEQPLFCGVCYSDHGGSVRGEIDCCNHYFCFVCIMEWAKHESRCPICRQRFSAIRRPPKEGLFPLPRVVKIPVRDQVYHPYGNMTSGPVDPYAHVLCSVCQGREDENLMLLCDLCDMASHTYCVGLGHVVPDGDWSCRDCATARSESNKGETVLGSEYDNQNATAEPAEAILDIVRDSEKQISSRMSRSISHKNLSLLRVIPVSDRVSRLSDKKSQLNVRTLSRCRSVHRHVQALRENWNALRSGSLRFSCSSYDANVALSHERSSVTVLHGRSSQPTSTSSHCQQSSSQRGSSSKQFHINGDKNVRKAWKMLEIAKTTKQTHQRSGSVPRQPRSEDKGHVGMEEGKYTCMEQNQEMCRHQKMKEESHYSLSAKDGLEQNEVLSSAPIRGYLKSPLLGKFQTGIHHLTCCADGPEILGENKYKDLSNASKQKWPICSVDLSKSNTGACGTPHDKPNETSFSGGDSHILNGRSKMSNSYGKGHIGKHVEAKKEIQSLVKLNLKHLSKDKQLAVNMFKEIARLATHTILAACGVEHRKSNVQTFTVSICSHAKDIEEFSKFNWIPNSCRKCFHIFVKDVVSSIVLEKVGE